MARAPMATKYKDSGAIYYLATCKNVALCAIESQSNGSSLFPKWADTVGNQPELRVESA